MASLEERLKAATADYQKLQMDLSNAVEGRQRLDAQLSENEMVKKVSNSRFLTLSLLIWNRCSFALSFDQEFATLKSENEVYKLIGPVLVKQDQAEAKSNVDKRLGFIKSEMCVTTAEIMGKPVSHIILDTNVNSQRVENQIKDITEKSEKRRAEVRD